MKMNRKRTGLFFGILLLALGSLCGCGTGSTDTKKSEKVRAEIEDVVQIPENGIITQEQFEAFAETDRIVTFQGEADGIKYAWKFSGRNIHNPKEMNLKIDFITADADLKEIKKISGDAPYAIGLKLQGEEVITVPTLTIELPEKWNADTAVYCFEEGKKAMKLSDASIQTTKDGSEEHTTLNVDVTEVGKTFYIVAGNSKGSAVESTDDQSGSSAETTEQKSDGNNSASNNSASQAAGSDNEAVQEETTETTESTQNHAQQTEANSSYSVTISINCGDILQHMDQLDSGKSEFVPSNGVILGTTTVECKEGDSVFDILLAVCQNYGIHMEHSYFPAYGSEYIEGINQLYEFDCGPLSGWKYSVNGWYPNYGCDKYMLSNGDVIQWNYVCE